MPASRPLAAMAPHPQLGRSVAVPGFVSAHSHAFQRGLRGKTQRAAHATETFWSWRDAMYALAASLTPESLYALSRRAFDEMALAGITAVGEFHYLHHDAGGVPYQDRTILGDTVVRAALDAGLAIALLRVAYARGGAGRPAEGAQRRFCDDDVESVFRDVDALRSKWQSEPRVRIGIAPHSVRAVPREWLLKLADYAQRERLPVHMHVAEQQAEIDACLAEHARRPVELLADCGLLNDRFCAVHATRIEHHEAAMLGAARAFACICPTTERDLGDGLADLAALRASGVRLCVGIDSHVITDHVEEIRALETHERLRLRRRVTFQPPDGRTLAEQLVLEGSAQGAAAIGFDVVNRGSETTWQPTTWVALDGQPSLAGVPDDACLDALVFSGTNLRFARTLL